MASELQVNTITEATSGSGITFAKDIIPATSLSHRNMVINGGMTVAQRGTGFSNIHGDQYAADRFKFDCGSEDELRLSITRENSGPTGFSHSVRLNVTTAESAIAADEYARISTIVESQDLQHLDYGASGAKTTTISFYVKSSLTGTYAMQLYQFDGPQNIGTTYTINAANTWEKKTITFVGNTSQAIANDNTAGIRLNWILMVGDDYKGTDNSSWGSYSGGRFGNGHTAAWGTNTSHDFWLSGVQWELGSVATPFEHRSFGDESERCFRYYQRNVGETKVIPVVNLSTTSLSTWVPLYKKMRAKPSSAGIVGTARNVSGGGVTDTQWAIYNNGSWRGCSTISIIQSASSDFGLRVDCVVNDSVNGGGASGLYGGVSCGWYAEAEL